MQTGNALKGMLYRYRADSGSSRKWWHGRWEMVAVNSGQRGNIDALALRILRGMLSGALSHRNSRTSFTLSAACAGGDAVAIREEGWRPLRLRGPETCRGAKGIRPWSMDEDQPGSVMMPFGAIIIPPAFPRRVYPTVFDRRCASPRR
jgi:hypothetical protein